LAGRIGRPKKLNGRIINISVGVDANVHYELLRIIPDGNFSQFVREISRDVLMQHNKAVSMGTAVGQRS
jgi:hypothetical protein